MSSLRKVFITVKTYPVLSRKYDELVCTAGIFEDGSWVRVYPLPYRKLDYDNRYKKYQWMELPLVRNWSDPRPESYRITDISKAQLLGEPIGTTSGWAARKEIIFSRNEIHSDLDALIKRANSNELSIAIFKPTKLIKFMAERAEREWNLDRLKNLRAKASQLSFFQSEAEVTREFSIVDKLPYKFSYQFQDSKGKQSTLMIEDWEIGALYWNCLKQTKGNEKEAIALVRRKYWEEFSSRDIFLFLGTTREFHGRVKNPFLIIGVFYPPVSPQESLF